MPTDWCSCMRILIVEDNPQDRELLTFALQDHFKTEAKFREAHSLQDAHDYLKRGNVDCILLDLQLPDSSGIDTFLHIYTAYPHIPIVVVSHNPHLELARQMVRAGAEDYILKDYTNTTAIFRRVLFAVERSRRNRERLMSVRPTSKPPPGKEEDEIPDTLPSGRPRSG